MNRDEIPASRYPHPITLDVVQYFPPGMRNGPTMNKHDQLYMGVTKRDSDGCTCLSVLAPGSSRRHNIEVGQIVSVTVRGRCHVPQTPASRYNIRGQELTQIIEGDFAEEWARPYFDSVSPKYYKREEENWSEPDRYSVEPWDDNGEEPAVDYPRRQGRGALSAIGEIVWFLLKSTAVVGATAVVAVLAWSIWDGSHVPKVVGAPQVVEASARKPAPDPGADLPASPAGPAVASMPTPDPLPVAAPAPTAAPDPDPNHTTVSSHVLDEPGGGQPDRTPSGQDAQALEGQP